MSPALQKQALFCMFITIDTYNYLTKFYQDDDMNMKMVEKGKICQFTTMFNSLSYLIAFLTFL